MTAFVLLGRKKLPPERLPSEDQIYDDDLQLWIDKSSGTPLVSCVRTHPQQSQVGETVKTASREGIDQTEGTCFEGTKFGETILTETREGADQSEGATLLSSEFGETVHTRTREGADQTEGYSFRASQVGETTLTKTREGVDQTEGATIHSFDAAHSHF